VVCVWFVSEGRPAQSATQSGGCGRGLVNEDRLCTREGSKECEESLPAAGVYLGHITSSPGATARLLGSCPSKPSREVRSRREGSMPAGGTLTWTSFRRPCPDRTHSGARTQTPLAYPASRAVPHLPKPRAEVRFLPGALSRNGPLPAAVSPRVGRDVMPRWRILSRARARGSPPARRPGPAHARRAPRARWGGGLALPGLPRCSHRRRDLPVHAHQRVRRSGRCRTPHLRRWSDQQETEQAWESWLTKLFS